MFFLISGATFPTFTKVPMSYTRVREAYAHKEKIINKTLAEHSISRDSMRIYLRAFKTEKKVELWAKNCSDTVFVLLREFPICELSGNVGPKRRSHDMQVPEGFYRISDLNPYSRYYLSMEVNYPNASDSIRGVRGRLGNEIYIHGDCISSGCLAMTDERMMELFVYCVEAYRAGQEEINITIFPTYLTDSNYSKLITRYSKYKDDVSLWADLKRGYDLFERYSMLPTVKFLPDGRHEVTEPSIVRERMVADSLLKRSVLQPLPKRPENSRVNLLQGEVSINKNIDLINLF